MSARKSPSDRVGRHKLTYEDLPITWDGETRGPDLPRGRNWHARTIKWWEMWRNSAQAMAFHESDWQHLQDTALLHHKMWSARKVLNDEGQEVWVDPSPAETATLAAEIRRRTEQYGMTWADRRKYGIVVMTPEEAAAEAEQLTRRSAAVDYKKKLLGDN